MLAQLGVHDPRLRLDVAVGDVDFEDVAHALQAQHEGSVDGVAAAGETGAGGHSFEWNGKDLNGLDAPAGDYTISISAKDAANNNVKTSTSVNLVIDAVEMHTEGAVLLSGKQIVNINDIIRIKGVA